MSRVETRSSQQENNVTSVTSDLLFLAKNCWAAGDIERLLQIRIEDLQPHADSAQIALLQAAASLQQGQRHNAMQLLQQVQTLGLSVKETQEFLLSQAQEVLDKVASQQITDNFKVDHSIFFHDLFYSLLRPLHPQGKALKRPSMFLLGPARTGKTLLAQKLQKEYGFAHLRLDEVFYTGKRRFPELPCDIASMVNYYAMLLKIHPTGLIIECDSLFLTPEPTRAADNAQILKRFMQVLGLGKDNVYFIGNSAITPAAKAEQVIQFRNSNRCWTKNAKMEGEELLQSAKMWIDYSVTIKTAAEAQGLSYFEINPASFDEASTRAANAIMAGINHD